MIKALPKNIHQQLELNSELPDLKSFDLYSHLKLNVKDYKKNCKDEVDNDKVFSYYCITCKISVCNLCNYNIHKSHLLINMLFNLERDSVDKIFKQIETDIETKELSINTSSIKQELKDLINIEITSLHKKLDELKESKFKEINTLFVNESPFSNIKSRINDTKNSVANFFEKNKKFLNYQKFNQDYENTVFLVVFEMLNLCVQKNKEIKGIILKLEKDYEDYKVSIGQKTSSIIKVLEEFRKPEDRQDALQPKILILSDFEKLNSDFFKDVRMRVQKYNEHVENFKMLTFENISKSGNLKEIEKIINLFDKKNERGIAFIFNQEIPEENKGVVNNTDLDFNCSSNKIKINQLAKSGRKSINKSLEYESEEGYSTNRDTNYLHKAYLSNSNSKVREDDINSSILTNKVAIKSKNDIKLNNPIIRRYFAYATLDIVNKNFRIKANAGGTSSAFLMVKPDFEMEEGTDVCKPIIGTNEIHIYDRKKRQLLKKKANLDKQLHGFNYFLDGTRHVLVNDKLFITGGRDENQEFNTVLTYDIKEFNLKRLPDMKLYRSYHSIEYVEMFKSLLVIGGQNNKTCELYDIFTNRWRLLPELKFPRANPLIYFDRDENHIYTLFGLKGEITQLDNYSDSIELLELQDMNKGWTIVEYENKSELDFKVNFCQIYPLTRNKILIYGANSSRSINKCFAVYCMDKCEIIKVDKKLLEELRLQARKSSKLSKILSTMSK